MKKLLTLAMAIGCGVVVAQDFGPQNSLAIIAGPNWAERFEPDCLGCGTYNTKVGYTLGLEYTLDVAVRWRIKMNVRYNVLNSEYQSDYFPFPPPSVPSYSEKHTDKVWQYLAGVRFLGKPRVWSWYADADAGVADIVESDTNTPKMKLRLSVGGGLGLAWQPAGKNTAAFVQPVVRYIFTEQNTIFTHGDTAMLIPAVEMGVRRHF